MKGDFSRVTFHPSKRYVRVLMQQGRIQLDADWNEQAAILLHSLRTQTVDLFGPHGAPKNNPGFSIRPVPSKSDFFIGGGHYYVDGILCEAGGESVPIVRTDPSRKQVQIPAWAVHNLVFRQDEYVEVFSDVQHSVETPSAVWAQIASIDSSRRTLTLDADVSGFKDLATARIRRVPTFRTQPEYPAYRDWALSDADLQRGHSYLIYLDVWERHISYLADDAIREVALGGPDTATRAKVVWQVKASPADGADCNLIRSEWAGRVGEWQPQNRGMLKAQAIKPRDIDQSGSLPPEAGYRGAENHLYRVEIHRGTSAAGATFTWSRENGSVALAIVHLRGNVATVQSLGRDGRLGLKIGDWIEVMDDDYELLNIADPLLQITAIDFDTMQITLSRTPGPNVGRDQARHPLLRRWDHKGTEGVTLDGGAVPLEEDKWLDLEDGIQIQFSNGALPEQPARYRTGDYWLVPARTATSDVEWPTAVDGQGKRISLELPSHGVEHHYAPLAIVSVGLDGTIDGVKDCRLCWGQSMP